MSFTASDFSDLALYQRRSGLPILSARWSLLAGVTMGASVLAAACALGAFATAGFVVTTALPEKPSLATIPSTYAHPQTFQTPYGTLASSARFYAARSSETYRDASLTQDLRGTMQGADDSKSASADAVDASPSNSSVGKVASVSSAPAGMDAGLPLVRALPENPPLPPVRAAAAPPPSFEAATAPALPASAPLPPVRSAEFDRQPALQQTAAVSPPLPPVRGTELDRPSLAPQEAASAPLPPARPDLRQISPAPATQVASAPAVVRTSPNRTVVAQAPADDRRPAAPGDSRNFFQKFFDALQQPNQPSTGVFGGPLPADYGSLANDGRTAVYDIAAHTVYLPNGERLEAHSGLGGLLDDPGHVNAKNRGATPPNLYDLALREQLFHGVQALRLTPVGHGAMFGRIGLLAHTYMLGPRGDSNGCVSFKDYARFLAAYRSGQIQHLAVVSHLSGDPSPAFASRQKRRRGMTSASASRDTGA